MPCIFVPAQTMLSACIWSHNNTSTTSTNTSRENTQVVRIPTNTYTYPHTRIYLAAWVMAWMRTAGFLDCCAGADCFEVMQAKYAYSFISMYGTSRLMSRYSSSLTHPPPPLLILLLLVAAATCQSNLLHAAYWCQRITSSACLLAPTRSNKKLHPLSVSTLQGDLQACRSRQMSASPRVWAEVSHPATCLLCWEAKLSLCSTIHHRKLPAQPAPDLFCFFRK